jgi:hypothetical protein
MDAETYFLVISANIPNATPGKMFGAKCINAPNNKAAAMFWKDHIVIRLEGELLIETLALDGVKMFEPMEGRTMNGWYQIPFDYKEKWDTLLATSMEIVKKMPPNPKKIK